MSFIELYLVIRKKLKSTRLLKAFFFIAYIKSLKEKLSTNQKIRYKICRHPTSDVHSWRHHNFTAVTIVWVQRPVWWKGTRRWPRLGWRVGDTMAEGGGGVVVREGSLPPGGGANAGVTLGWSAEVHTRASHYSWSEAMLKQYLGMRRATCNVSFIWKWGKCSTHCFSCISPAWKLLFIVVSAFEC